MLFRCAGRVAVTGCSSSRTATAAAAVAQPRLATRQLRQMVTGSCPQTTVLQFELLNRFHVLTYLALLHVPPAASAGKRVVALDFDG